MREAAVNAIEEIFDLWKRCAGHPRSRLDPKRARLIVTAMRWGYTLADLKLAVLGICNSRYHLGENDRQGVYTDLGLCLRDGDHIDKFIKLGEQELRRSWAEACAEDEARRPKKPMPEEARSRMAVLSQFKPKPLPKL